MLGRALAVALLAAMPAAGEPLPAELGPGEAAEVREAIDGDTLQLADGRRVRLAAVTAPMAMLPRRDAAPVRDARLEALAAAARETLNGWTRGRPVTLHVVAAQSDRHGRRVAHVVAPAHGWIQAALLSQGLARVQTTEATAVAARTLLRIEAAARAARRGLWAHPVFQVRTAQDSGRWLDSFQLVEGSVAAVRNARSVSRVEIGTAERRLTIILSARARTELRRDGVDMADLLGRNVRVRGWIGWQDGARMEISHAAALELLER